MNTVEQDDLRYQESLDDFEARENWLEITGLILAGDWLTELAISGRIDDVDFDEGDIAHEMVERDLDHTETVKALAYEFVKAHPTRFEE